MAELINSFPDLSDSFSDKLVQKRTNSGIKKHTNGKVVVSVR